MSKHNFLQIEVVTSSFCTDSWLITFWLGWNSRDLAGWPKWTTQTAKLVFHHFLLIFCPPSPLCVLLSHGGGEEAIWTPSESCTETNHFLPAFVKCSEGQRSGSNKFHEEMLHRAGPLPLFSFYCVCWGSEGFMLSGLRWCNAAWTSQELDVGQDNKEPHQRGHEALWLSVCELRYHWHTCQLRVLIMIRSMVSIYQSIYVLTLTSGHELWVVTQRMRLQIQPE